jgi:hypothetical protein
MNFITVKVHSAIAAVCCKALRSCERPFASVKGLRGQTEKQRDTKNSL